MINSILLTDFTGFANTRFDFTKGIKRPYWQEWYGQDARSQMLGGNFAGTP